MAIRLIAHSRACAYPLCGIVFLPWHRDQRFHTVRCCNLFRWMGRERTKRACHLEARKSLKDRCEGRLPSGRACNRVRNLHVHHRDSNYRNNAESNLATLCRGCHVRAHGKKTWRDNNRRLKAA